MATGKAAAAPRSPAIRSRGKPTDIDRHVGTRIRQRRVLLGMSQTALAEALGLTFQQVQKYERGQNRVGAGRLFSLSQALDVPVAYFFEDVDPPPAPDGSLAALGLAMKPKETALLRDFQRVQSQHVRDSIAVLVKALAGAEPHPQADPEPA